ncbi:hypothetical protein DXB97_04485 [Firmicutes bacterium OM07-11]|nr:hypothetical protein DXB97_04485 [Firmicutes bacterium OM07-11]
MENKELKEYLGEFSEDSDVSIIVANPEDRKVYMPEAVLLMKDEEVQQPCFIVKMDEDIAREVEEAVQSELPKLKNNDQRKEFLKTYRDWPVWFEVPQADEVYYRYVLPDGSAIVICEYKQYVDWKRRYTDENPESTYTKSYLLKPRYRHLHDCETNETTLVRKLMEVQKR